MSLNPGGESRHPPAHSPPYPAHPPPTTDCCVCFWRSHWESRWYEGLFPLERVLQRLALRDNMSSTVLYVYHSPTNFCHRVLITFSNWIVLVGRRAHHSAAAINHAPPMGLSRINHWPQSPENGHHHHVNALSATDFQEAKRKLWINTYSLLQLRR